MRALELIVVLVAAALVIWRGVALYQYTFKKNNL
jgi:hypothetical protein